jgi:amino acid adenylation domain-containing protein
MNKINEYQKAILNNDLLTQEPIFNIPIVIKLNGVLNTDKLQSCLTKLTNKYPFLKMKINKEHYDLIENHDLVLDIVESNNEDLLNDINQYAATKIDIFNQNLCFVKYFKTQTNDYLLIVIHHIITDEWSNNILLQDLSNLYLDNQIKLESEQTLIYCTDSINYWYQKLSDIDIKLPIFSDKKRPKNTNYNGKTIEAVINSLELYEMQTFCKTNKITLFTFLLDKFSQVLHKFTEEENIVIGIPNNCRNEENESIVGPLVKVLPFVSRKNESLVQKQDQLLEDSENVNLSLVQLYEKLCIKNDTNFNPLFNFLFTFNTDLNEELFNLPIEYIDLNSDFAKFDLSCFCSIKNNKLKIKINYSKDIIDDFLAKTFVSEFIRERKDDLYIHQVFSTIVKTNSYSVAVIDQDRKYTYDELDLASNKVANFLNNLSLNKNPVVAIKMDTSFNLIACIFGVLKIGGTYILIDSELPEKRIEYILKHSETEYLITKDTIFSNNDKFQNAYESYISTIIYTSGSTGKPKGVLYRHISVINRLKWIKKKYPFNQKTNCLISANVSFVDFITELFMPLLSGSKVIIAPKKLMQNPDEFIDFITKYDINRINITPSLIIEIVDRFNNLPKIDHIEISGEKFSENLQAKVIKKFNQSVIINRYGSTEATAVIYQELNPINNYYIIDNTQVTIRDKDLNIKTDGVTGEICISGSALSAGYHREQEQTNNKFINKDGILLYKTGDLGCIDSKGNIKIIDRKDNQIKINGYRIELQEIDCAIESCLNVKKCITIFKTKLVSYVISDIKINQNDIKKELSKILPSYMIPNQIIQIDKIPLNNSGKINYDTLRSYNTQKKQILPKNIKEFKLLKILEEILDLKDISTDDNFFQIGGNSILAIRFASKIQKTFNISFGVNNLYKHQTITEIANNLEDSEANLYSDLVLNIQTDGNKTPMFLIHPARGLSFPYSGLAKFIKDRKIYGINHPFYSNKNKTFNSIEEMALFYINIIKKICSNGPYILGGWSFGGLVALEMATILKPVNVEVLILFDTSNYPKEMILDLTEEELENGLQRIGITGKHKESEFFRKNSIIANNITKKYQPKKYNGRTILIKAQDEEFKNDFRKNDIYQGWSNIFSQIEIYSTKGEHNFLWTTENLPGVANAIKHGINKIYTKKDIMQFAKDYNDEFMIKRILELENSKLCG